GQPDCAAGAWVQRRLELAPRVAERVDAQVELPRNAAEVRVVRSLDTRLPDLVARAVRLAELLQLLRRDFARVSEQLRGELPVRVAPRERVRDPEPGVVLAVLEQVPHLRLAHLVLDHDR